MPTHKCHMTLQSSCRPWAVLKFLMLFGSVYAQQQVAAYKALRRGIMDYERRQVYRGPEKFLNLPEKGQDLEDAIDEALDDHPDNGDVMAAVVLEADSKHIKAQRQGGEVVDITGDGLKPAQSGLSDKAQPNIKLRKGAIIRVAKTVKGTWEITQLPEVEAAFVAIDPRDGAIKALVGGFDFAKNKFNHVTQAWRQPGSSFKPFIYSAALEKGFTPATVVNDAPLFFDGGVTGGQPWEPKNYDGKFEGPMSLRTGLAKSKNMVSIRVLQAVGARNTQEWITRFGFDEDKHPAYLTMALGAGSVTPMQMATAYSVFANGGYYVPPVFISKITDYRGNVLQQTPVHPPDDSQRVIEARNAFVMDSLLQEVARSGTAARAQATLKRPDLYGKTGTTNESKDAWFSGYNADYVTTVWTGFDQPESLGRREYGGTVALPIWMNYMSAALKDKPPHVQPEPEGILSLRVDPVSGRAASPSTPGAYFELFKSEDTPPSVNELGNGVAPGSPLPADEAAPIDLF